MASIRKRGGGYQITVSCGYDITGKKLIQTTTFTPDPNLSPKKQEIAVKNFALEFENKIKSGYAMDGRKITLKNFAEKWLEEYAKPNLAAGTVVKYTEELHDKILPALGHLKLSTINPSTLNSFYQSMLKDGARKDGKAGGYSRATISKTHNVLSSIMRTAVEWEIIERNPCGKVKVPSIPKTADNIKFFTPEQTAAFLAYTEEPHTWEVKAHNRIDDTAKGYTVGQYTSQKGLSLQLQVLFHMAIYTGMRKGELLALKWPDIDFENNTVHVTKSVSVLKGRVIIKEPKTRTSHRTITIPQSLTVKLQKLRISQSEYRLSVGEYWQNEDWIFTQDNGKMMNYSTPYHALQNTIKWYNQSHPENEALPLIPFYGLRHTSATLLIAGKQDVKTVSSRLGHAQTSTTMNIYAHALQEGDQRAADTLETILKKHS